MNMDKSFSCSRNLVAFLLLFIIIFLIYSNTFHASWHLDDYPNITDNSRLKITDLSIDSIVQTFFALPDSYGQNNTKKLYRPIPCLTFAINWYLGKDNVVGYHLVNIGIHILTAFFLFITIITLFKSPILKEKYQGSEYFIALLASTLWAVHPIQTQAVTYIVQRMASMAAMFYILGICFYLKGRINPSRLIQIFLYLGCFVSYMFAIGSKENAVTLPLALLLVEITFFQDGAFPKNKGNVFYVFMGIGILFVFICLGLFLIMKGDPLALISNLYENRPFSLTERLLTEPRILMFYLLQLIYPTTNLLSIDHDVIISTSLLEPFTTVPAILGVFFIFATGLILLRKQPVISFAICFFFLTHLIESSVLPLELIFDHRNYLPSLFLFFPISVGLKQVLDYYIERKRSVYLVVVAFVSFLLIGVGMGAYTRNMSWVSEKTTWEDAIAKAPRSHRALHNYAWSSYDKTGEFDKALELYKMSLQFESPISKNIHAKTLNSMAKIYYKKGEYEEAIHSLKKALSIYPGYKNAIGDLVFSQVKLGKWKEALFNIDEIIKKHPDDHFYLNQKGLILLKRGRLDEAISNFYGALQKSPNYSLALLNVGVALSLKGDYEKAHSYLYKAKQILVKDITVRLAMIENKIRAGEKEKAAKYSEDLLNSLNLQFIEGYLKKLYNENSWNPISLEIVVPAIAQAVEKRAIDIHSISVDGFIYSQ